MLWIRSRTRLFLWRKIIGQRKEGCITRMLRAVALHDAAIDRVAFLGLPQSIRSAAATWLIPRYCCSFLCFLAILRDWWSEPNLHEQSFCGITSSWSVRESPLPIEATRLKFLLYYGVTCIWIVHLNKEGQIPSLLVGAMRDCVDYEFSEECMLMVAALLERSLNDGHDLMAIHE